MTKIQAFLRTFCYSLIAAATLALSPVQAAPSKCANQYFLDQRPDFVNPKLELSSMELCSDYFATMYSGVAKSPLYSAEYLTQGRLQAAKQYGRSNDFRPDTRIPSSMRAELSSFKGSGYDRGHLAPSADMPTPGSDSQSFLLSNMVAQDPTLNRGLWAAIEGAVRAQANYSPVYVITGAMFRGNNIKRIKGGVLVPTHVYKLVFDPKANAAAAYVVENAPNKRHQEVSLQELESLAGIKFLPGATNVRTMKLPRPRY